MKVDPAIQERNNAIEKIELELSQGMTKATQEEIRAVATTIVDESAKGKFDPLFILAIIEAESNFDIEAVSPSGARGLMQIIPSTWKQVSSAQRMFDPVENVRTGIKYLNMLSNEYRFRDPETYLLAYNQGPGAVKYVYQQGQPMPEEAASYIPNVMDKYRKTLQRFGKDAKQARTLFRTV